MPAFAFKPLRILALTTLAAAAALAQAAPLPATARGPVRNSDLDANLFYQLLLGEIELRSGEAGTAYQIVLDAARRGKQEELFKRATDIALQARAGDQALAAANAWHDALPIRWMRCATRSSCSSH